MNTQIIKQKEYTSELDKESKKVQIVVPQAFVRGMRDLGYKDPSKALAELVDNAQEAGATWVHVIFEYDTKDKKKLKPIGVAVFDNGCGMIPRMIPRSMTWGGTSRENSRDGFGRYGFGLPASCVSIGTKFSVYSKSENQEMLSVTVDLEDVANQSGSYEVNEPSEAKLPSFVNDYLSTNNLPLEYESCTLVHIENCDNFTRSTTAGLSNLFMEHFAITYHKAMRGFDIFVNSRKVEPLDPLFTTSTARFFNIDEDVAKGYSPIIVDFKDQNTREIVGKIKVRFSILPPTFHLKDKNKSPSKDNFNGRWSIMRSHCGLVVSRNGRVIDIINSINGIRLNNNNDRFVRIELDFDATLDEFFGVTTSKQQITIDDRVVELLKRDGFFKTLKNLRSHNKSNRKEMEAKHEDQNTPENQTAIATANKASKIFKENQELQKRRDLEGKENILKEAKKRAKVSKRPLEDEVGFLEAASTNTSFNTKLESSEGGPFFRVEWLGSVLTLYLNQKHRFFTDIFMSEESSERTRTALKLLLIAIGWSQEEASDDARLIYKVEIPEWSKKLDVMLDILTEAHDPEDLVSSDDEVELSDTSSDKVA